MSIHLTQKDIDLLIAIVKGQNKEGKMAIPWKQIQETGNMPEGLNAGNARSAWQKLAKKIGFTASKEKSPIKSNGIQKSPKKSTSKKKTVKSDEPEEPRTPEEEVFDADL